MFQNPAGQSFYIVKISKLSEDRQDFTSNTRHQQNYQDREAKGGAKISVSPAVSKGQETVSYICYLNYHLQCCY